MTLDDTTYCHLDLSLVSHKENYKMSISHRSEFYAPAAVSICICWHVFSVQQEVQSSWNVNRLGIQSDI